MKTKVLHKLITVITKKSNDLESVKDEAEATSWLESQPYMLVAGLICGLLFHKLFTSTSYSQKTNSHRVQEDQANSDMGVTASRSTFSSFAALDNKMVLIIRTDLGMTKGKVAAQCAHAAIGCYKRAMVDSPRLLKQWEILGQTKITLKADNEDVLYELQKKAKNAGIVSCVVHDAGRTQVHSGTPTVLGLGPAPVREIDQITGHLKLY